MAGGTGDDILVGDGDGDDFDAGTGNDFIFAGVGNDTVVWNANAGTTADPTDGRDYVDGGNSNINPVTTGAIVVTGTGGATGNRLNFNEGTDGTQTITRAVDLTGSASATLTFTWRVDDTEGDDDMLVQAFNGTTWDTIGTLDGGAAENTDITTFTANLTAAQRGAHSAIRFVSPNLGGGENFYIDNVNIATPTGNFRDEFSAQAYNNSNGTRAWTTSWTEANDVAETDTFVVNGNDSVEDFKVYARANALAAGLAGLKADTEIVITRNGAIIAELDNIEEIVINTGGGEDTVTPIGSFDPTSLAFNTISINSGGNDTVNVSELTSQHRVHVKANGGTINVVGELRPQDIIEGAAQAPATGGSQQPAPGANPTPNSGSGGSGSPAPGTGAGSATGAVVYTGRESGGTGVGGALGDILSGMDGADVLFGMGGDDSLSGHGGDDYLRGDGGNDLILAGAGDDIVRAGDGDDEVFGGSGVDRIEGGAGNDRINGELGNDVIDAGAGDDTIFASRNDGNDFLDGGDGDADTIDFQAIAANLVIRLSKNGTGSAQSSETGHDVLSGIENVKGGTGNDTIHASTAANVLNGGSGDDTFVFNSAAAANGDRVEGFAPGDKIDLSPFMPNGGTFVAENAAFNAAGMVRLVFVGEGTKVEGLTDDGTGVDFSFVVNGRHSTESDFT